MGKKLSSLDRDTKIVVGFLVVCVVIVGAFIAYQAFTHFTGSTEIYFTRLSDLPDPDAALKYGKVDGEALNVLDVGKSYKVSFTVVCSEAGKTSYDLLVDSRLLSKEESFTLNPGENRTFSYTLSPTDDSKWVYSHSESRSSREIYDLTSDSWLGERGEFTDAYMPPSVLVGRFWEEHEVFGDILNLNMSLDDLRTRPYRMEYSDSSTQVDYRRVTSGSVVLSVAKDDLELDLSEVSRVYKSPVDIFKATLLKEGGDKPQVISFWYQVK